jgi:hypothetical protein
MNFDEFDRFFKPVPANPPVDLQVALELVPKSNCQTLIRNTQRQQPTVTKLCKFSEIDMSEVDRS